MTHSTGVALTNVAPDEETGGVLRRESTDPFADADEERDRQNVETSAFGAPVSTITALGGALDIYVPTPMDRVDPERVDRILDMWPPHVGVPMSEGVTDQLVPEFDDLNLPERTGDSLSVRESNIEGFGGTRQDLDLLGTVTRDVADNVPPERLDDEVEQFLDATAPDRMTDTDLGAELLFEGAGDEPDGLARETFEALDEDNMSQPVGQALLERARPEDIDEIETHGAVLASVLRSESDPIAVTEGITLDHLSPESTSSTDQSTFPATDVEAIAGPKARLGSVDGPLAWEIRHEDGGEGRWHLFGADPIKPGQLGDMDNGTGIRRPHGSPDGVDGLFVPLDGQSYEFDGTIAEMRPDAIGSTDPECRQDHPTERLRGFNPRVLTDEPWVVEHGDTGVPGSLEASVDGVVRVSEEVGWTTAGQRNRGNDEDGVNY